MIQAKDLMIGDIIHVDYDFSEIVGTVSGIANGKIIVETQYGSIAVYKNEVFPISLTPEILEKNFEKKTFYGIYDDYFDLDIREYSDGLYIVTYHSCEFNIPDQTIHVSWVHELQHFLNHCGITHEIKL